MMKEVSRTSEVIHTDSGFITLTVFQKTVPTQTAGIILINPATAVKQAYYQHYASFLAAHNYTVITFDYQGIGQSVAKELTHYSNHLHDFAQDIKLVFDYLVDKYQSEIIIVGHSIGGSFIGFSDVASSPFLKGFYSICMQNGYMGFSPKFSTKAQLVVLYFLLIPILSRLLGYFPAKLLKMGEDLPRYVAREFARWCRNKSFFFKYLSQNNHLNHYHLVKAPVMQLNFSDDEWSSQEAINSLSELFTQAPLEKEYVSPSEIGVSSIGHMGFFKAKMKKTLWQSSLTWINQLSL